MTAPLTATPILVAPAAGLGPAPETATLQFTLGDNIGANEGRKSTVYLGRDLQLDAELVYKKIPVTSIAAKEEYWDEARRLHDARHPHVVPIKYACEQHGFVYLAMPYYSAGSLQRRLNQGAMTVREIVKCGLEFLMGLHHAHVRGIVHFDVKPTNVLFDPSGAASLADFGQSRKVDGLGLAEQPDFYYPHAAPERNYASKLTKVSDVFQAGLTLYRMGVGNAAWYAQIQALGGSGSSKFGDAVVKGTFPDRKAYPIHIPSRLRTLIADALAVDPDKRTPTALDLMLALAAVDQRLDWRWSRTVPAGEEWFYERDSTDLRLRLRETNPGKWAGEVFREGAKSTFLKTKSIANVSEEVARKHLERYMANIDKA
jgi:eukaryotic-like serine/threonine-protein kinase